MIVIGVDPGLTGAVAFYDVVKDALVDVHDMPLLVAERTRSRKARRQIDLAHLSILIDAHAPLTKIAVVEDVSAMTYVDSRGQTRGQGAAASFNFGKATGSVLGILAGCMIPIAMVRPGVWKSLMNLTHDKDLSRQEASRLFPEHKTKWSRKMDDGRAEASLLAYFAAKRLV